MPGAEEPATQSTESVVRALTEENERLKSENKWLKGLLTAAGVVVVFLLVWLLVSRGVVDAKGKRDADNPPREGSLGPLFQLIQSLFNTEEVERFVQLYLGEDGLEVWQSLASARSESDLFSKLLLALKRRGLLDASFFDALVAERPRQEESIRQVQRQYLEGGGAPQVSATRPAVPSVN